MKHLAAVAAVLLVLVGGLWFWAGVVAPGYWSAVVLGVLWCVAVSVAAGRAGKALPSVKRTLRVTSILALAALAAGSYWTSVRETTVDEPIVQGAPASSLSPEELAQELGEDPLAPQP